MPYLFIVDTRLNDFISHFEGLNYDTNHLHQSHSRAKRSTDSEKATVSLRFSSHGRFVLCET